METGESPCVKICVLDPVSGFCIGCGRTGAEIGAWLGLTIAERVALKAELRARLRRMTSREARGRRRPLPLAGEVIEEPRLRDR